MNMLLCWMCSPNQATFYQAGVLTVCDTFCQQLYAACPSFSAAYASPTAMCTAFGYATASYEYSQPCFNAGPASMVSGLAVALLSVLAWLAALL